MKAKFKTTSEVVNNEQKSIDTDMDLKLAAKLRRKAPEYFSRFPKFVLCVRKRHSVKTLKL